MARFGRSYLTPHKQRLFALYSTDVGSAASTAGLTGVAAGVANIAGTAGSTAGLTGIAVGLIDFPGSAGPTASLTGVAVGAVGVHGTAGATAGLTGLAVGVGVAPVGPPLTMPQQHIYLQLADPWTTPDFTVITGLVKQWSGGVSGRQHELQLFQPGQVALTLESNLNGGRFNPWNTSSPYYNLLSPDDAAQIESNGTWTLGGASNCWLGTFPTVPPVDLDIGYALKMVCSGSSPSSINNEHVYSVVSGQWYSVMGSFLANTTARTCTVGIQWYNSANSLIGTSTSSGVTDNTTSWSKASLLGVQAPAGAVTAAIIFTVTGASSSEVHWACRMALFNYSGNVPNTAWAPGQRGLVPGRPMYCTAEWGGNLYNVWSMYISNLTPAYGQVKSEMVINCSDALALLGLGDVSSSVYANQVINDGAGWFWRLGDPQYSTLAQSSITGLNEPLAAYHVDFGQQSPLLTDDTTAALMQASSESPGGFLASTTSITSTVGSLEFSFLMPPQTEDYTIMFGTTNISGEGGYIAYNAIENIFGLHTADPLHGALVNANIAIDDGNWHHCIITWSAAFDGTCTLYLDGVNVASEVAESTTMFNGNPFTFGAQTYGGSAFTFNGSFADIAVYNGNCLTESQVAEHYTLWASGFLVQYSGQRIQAILDIVDWPANLQNIATGISLVQGATSSLTQTSVLAYLQSIEATELGALFVNPSGVVTYYDRHYIITATAATVSNGTFTNRPAAAGTYFRYQPGLVPAMDDTDLWNDVPGQRNGGVIQRTANQTSISQYGRRSLTGYTGELQTNDAEVLAQTQWLVSHYSAPYTRVRQITLSSVSDSGKNLAQMLGRQIFDNIYLEWLPIDQSNVYFTQQSLIESIKHTVTQETWITTWGLSPAETQPYMILNNATRGQLSTVNRLAY